MTYADASFSTAWVLLIAAALAWWPGGGSRWVGFPRVAAYILGSLAILAFVATLWLRVGE